MAAHEKLGLAHLLLAADGHVPAESGFADVLRDAEWLLKRDPRSLRGHLFMSRYHTYYTRDWAKAQDEADVAFLIRHDDWGALYSSGELAIIRGDFGKAELLFKAALVIDPLNADARYELAFALLWDKRLDEAESEMRRAVAITPTYIDGPAGLALVLLAENRPQEALAAAGMNSDDGIRTSTLAIIQSKAGHRAVTEQYLRQSIERHGQDQPAYIAFAYACMGSTDVAYEWFNRAYQSRDPWLIYVRPFMVYANGTADPRFRAFMREMNLPE